MHGGRGCTGRKHKDTPAHQQLDKTIDYPILVTLGLTILQNMNPNKDIPTRSKRCPPFVHLSSLSLLLPFGRSRLAVDLSLFSPVTGCVASTHRPARRRFGPGGSFAG